MVKKAQADQIAAGQGFIAALDQSGGSTPKALEAYGIGADAYANDGEMYDLIHAMRTRIIKSPAFTGQKVLGAILFEMTMERDIDGKPTAQMLWEDRGVVPFLKVDNGLADVADGVQLLKPMPDLDALLTRAVGHGMFGTKMRSVIWQPQQAGVAAIVAQQFEIGAQILAHGLVPILEPEVNIDMTDKRQAEAMLCDALLKGLDGVPEGQQVMFKLTLPEVPNQYQPLVGHPKVLAVVALSGGYTLGEANRRLAQNQGVIASFSRALAQDVSAQQSDTDFDATLAATIDSIYQASIAG